VSNLTFKYGDSNIVYLIEYSKVIEEDNKLLFEIDLQRVQDDVRVTVVRRVLLTILFQEMREIITKYMGMTKLVNITLMKDLEEGI
jgi:hypothetical protein